MRLSVLKLIIKCQVHAHTLVEMETKAKLETNTAKRSQYQAAQTGQPGASGLEPQDYKGL